MISFYDQKLNYSWHEWKRNHCLFDSMLKSGTSEENEFQL